MSSRAGVRPLTSDELERLDVPRLRAYRKQLRALLHSPDESDLDAAQLQQLDPTLIRFKTDPRWRLLMDSIEARLT